MKMWDHTDQLRQKGMKTTHSGIKYFLIEDTWCHWLPSPAAALLFYGQVRFMCHGPPSKGLKNTSGWSRASWELACKDNVPSLSENARPMLNWMNS